MKFKMLFQYSQQQYINETEVTCSGSVFQMGFRCHRLPEKRESRHRSVGQPERSGRRKSGVGSRPIGCTHSCTVRSMQIERDIISPFYPSVCRPLILCLTNEHVKLFNHVVEMKNNSLHSVISKTYCDHVAAPHEWQQSVQ